MRRLTEAEALAEIEVLIEDFRAYRSSPTQPEHVTYLALKMAADDLRGRMKGKPCDARAALQNAVERMQASKTPLGFEQGHMRAVAQVVVGHWATIRQALERFEKVTR